MTHEELIQCASRWLARQGCCVVVTDMSTAAMETPDAIGWRSHASILIECKTSRSDFAADARKPFRINPGMGMGNARYYMTTAGLLSPDEIPSLWGLLECSGRRVTQVKKATRFPESNTVAERGILISSLRRLGLANHCGVSVKCYTIPSKNRATIGVLEYPESTQL